MRAARACSLRLALVAAGAVALATILAALVFQYGFGYAPCPLCLQQRWPYYVGAPVALVAAAPYAVMVRLRPILALGLIGLFAWGLYLGVYQAGAEWRYWPGPRDCSAGNSGEVPAGVGDLFEAIQNSAVVSCTDPQFRFLSLSFAGWNAVVMAGLILLLLIGLVRHVRSR